MRNPATRGSGITVLAAVGVGALMAAVIAAQVGAGGATIAAGAVLFLGVGLVLGWGAMVVAGVAVLGIPVAVAAAKSSETGTGWWTIVWALVLWGLFELACFSLENRPPVSMSPPVRAECATNLGLVVVLTAVAGALVQFALLDPPSGGVILRVAAVLVVSGTVGAVVLVSRRSG